MENRKGFTLIELLVVIAIIALLLSIALPGLKAAKLKAMEILSINNARGLVMCWRLYTEDNKSKLVCGTVSNVNSMDSDQSEPVPPARRASISLIKRYDWVFPIATDIVAAGHEQELEGIRRGALFPYTNEYKLYHSPGDRDWLKNADYTNTGNSPYRSYAISNAMNGQQDDPKWQYRKISEIGQPAGKIVFLEEEDKGNFGSWVLNNVPTVHTWHDPVSSWYAKGSTVFSFADGRAEKHRWVDQSTLRKLGLLEPKEPWNAPIPAGEGADLNYMKRSYSDMYYRASTYP